MSRERKIVYENIMDWWKQDFKRNVKSIAIHFSVLKKADVSAKINFNENCLLGMAEKNDRTEMQEMDALRNTWS